MSRKTIYIVAFIVVIILSIGLTIWIKSDKSDANDDTKTVTLSTDVSSEALDSILLEEQEFAKNNTSDVDTKELQAELPIAKQVETPGEDSLDPHLQAAKELIKAFRIDEAVQELIQADETAERLYYQGLIYAYKGEKENAINMFQQAKAKSDDDPLISAYVDKYLDTYNLFATFKDASPEYLDTLISKDFLATGELQLGIAKLKYVVSIHPEYVDAQILLGSAYMVHGNFPKAVETLTTILPSNIREVYYWLGLAYYYDGNNSKAIVAYKQAINKSYKPAYKLYEKIADVYLSQKNYQQAAEYYVKAVNEPEAKQFINFYIRPVWLYNDILKNPDEGLKISQQAVSTLPNNAMAYNLMGWSYIAMKEYDRALENLEEARRIDPELPAVYLNLGLLYKAQKEWELAKENFKTASSMDQGSIGERAEREYLTVVELENVEQSHDE